MNESKRRRIAICIAIFGLLVLLVPSVVVNFNIPRIPKKSYIISERYSEDWMDIWQTDHSTIAINKTEVEYIGLFNVTYNETTQKIHIEQIDAWILNRNTTQVFESTNTTYTIQWAINNSDYLKFAKGVYNLTATVYLHSNMTLDGNGATLIMPPNTQVPLIMIQENSTDIRVQNLFLHITPFLEIDGNGR